MEGISDTENMSDTEQPDHSPLFTKLPAEIRLEIYSEIFEGSKTAYKQSLVIGQRTYRNTLWPTEHRNFLITCRKAYTEASGTYWSKTILYGDDNDREIVSFLQSVVPGFAKLHIKHIRGLCAVTLWQHPVRGCLGGFRSLQTIGFQYKVIFNMTRRDNPPTIQEQIAENLQGAHWRFDNIIYDGGPVVICRVVYRRVVNEGRRLVKGEFKKDRKVCFYNCSTGKTAFADGRGPIDEDEQEACFAMVLDNQAPAEEAPPGALREHEVGNEE